MGPVEWAAGGLIHPLIVRDAWVCEQGRRCTHLRVRANSAASLKSAAVTHRFKVLLSPYLSPEFHPGLHRALARGIKKSANLQASQLNAFLPRSLPDPAPGPVHDEAWSADLGNTISCRPAAARCMRRTCKQFITELCWSNRSSCGRLGSAAATRARRVVGVQGRIQALEQLVKHGLFTPIRPGESSRAQLLAWCLAAIAFWNAWVRAAWRSSSRPSISTCAITWPSRSCRRPARKSRPSNRGSSPRCAIVARLRHPNIVAANDAGRTVSDDGNTTSDIS